MVYFAFSGAKRKSVRLSAFVDAYAEDVGPPVRERIINDKVIPMLSIVESSLFGAELARDVLWTLFLVTRWRGLSALFLRRREQRCVSFCVRAQVRLSETRGTCVLGIQVPLSYEQDTGRARRNDRQLSVSRHRHI